MTEEKQPATKASKPVKGDPRAAANEQLVEAQQDVADALQAKHDATIAAVEAKIEDMNAPK